MRSSSLRSVGRVLASVSPSLNFAPKRGQIGANRLFSGCDGWLVRIPLQWSAPHTSLRRTGRRDGYQSHRSRSRPAAAVARALPARFYTGPDSVTLDRTAVFRRSRQLLAHASQLAQPGDLAIGEIAGVRCCCCAMRTTRCARCTTPAAIARGRRRCATATASSDCVAIITAGRMRWMVNC